jgi:hypothetical protein
MENFQIQDTGSGMNTWDLIFESKILQFFYADPEPGSGISSTRDPGSGMEKVGSGKLSRIRNTGGKRQTFIDVFLG